MKNLKLTLALAALVAFVGSAQATPITGGISLAGGYTVDTANINTANAFTSFSAVQATSVSGNYVGLVTLNTPGSVTMTPFSFDPFPIGAVKPLWTTGAASFDLLALTKFEQPGDDSLKLEGTGTLFLTGYDPTPGRWVFTANNLSGTFSFSSSNGALGVPDGGTTAMLLGSALAGLAFLRRKLA